MNIRFTTSAYDNENAVDAAIKPVVAATDSVTINIEPVKYGYDVVVSIPDNKWTKFKSLIRGKGFIPVNRIKTIDN